MLVLSRQRDESIVIGDNVIVTIVDVRGDRVRLGIEAPREVSVHRREVYDAIQRENQQASQIQPDQARRISEGAQGVGHSTPGFRRTLSLAFCVRAGGPSSTSGRNWQNRAGRNDGNDRDGCGQK